MQYTQTIIKVARNLNIHPIYLKMYSSRCVSSSEEEFIKCLMTYIEFKEESPRPFVKWVGGKRQLAQQFRDMNLFPPDDFDPNKSTYFEPFVGGGAMFFDLLPKKAVLSDLNKELVTTYNTIKKDVDKLISKLKVYKKKHDKEFYYKVRSQNTNMLSDLSIATRFIYLNKTCFNGLYRVNKSGGFNVPMNDSKNPTICDEENLRKVNKSLKGISINNQDYKSVLKRAKKGDFIYFDPPYYPVNRTSNFTSYTSSNFLEKEQEELKGAYVELHNRGCFVMLSNSDTPFINKLYSKIDKKIRIKKVFAGRSINSKGGGRGKISEIIVINY